MLSYLGLLVATLLSTPTLPTGSARTLPTVASSVGRSLVRGGLLPPAGSSPIPATLVAPRSSGLAVVFVIP